MSSLTGSCVPTLPPTFEKSPSSPRPLGLQSAAMRQSGTWRYALIWVAAIKPRPMIPILIMLFSGPETLHPEFFDEVFRGANIFRPLGPGLALNRAIAREA